MPFDTYYVDPNSPNSTFKTYEVYRQRLPESKKSYVDKYHDEYMKNKPVNLQPEEIKDLKWRVVDAAYAEAPKGGPTVGRLDFTKNQVVNAFAIRAYQKAAEQLNEWRDDPVYPDDPAVCLSYPGVDPRGKYCAVDMSLAARMERIKAAASISNDQRKAALNAAFQNLEKHDTEPMKSTMARAERTFATIRETERAAKLCPEPQTSALLAAGAKVLANETPELQELDRYYTALEHIAGIRKGPVPQEVLNTARNYHLDTALVAQPAPAYSPTEMNVEFRNFDHTSEQRFFSHPDNWTRKPNEMPREPKDPEALSKYADEFATRTAQQHLELLYGDQIEAMSHTLIIDGKTLDERLREEYSAQNNNSNGYNNWKKQNYQRRAAEYVASALMTDKDVEAFVPDAKGNLPEKPTNIVRSDRSYTPTPLRPVTLNAWERFWSRCGFYKEKVREANRYQRQQDLLAPKMAVRARAKANYDAERIRAKEPVQPSIQQMFLGDLDRTEFKNSLAPGHPYKKISMERSSLTSICICCMAAMNYSIQDILDPDFMPDEKRAIGQEVMKRMDMDPATGKPGGLGDTEWLTRFYYAGQQALMNQVDQMMQGVDLQNHEQLMQVLPDLNACACVLGDVYQDSKKANLAPGFDKMTGPNGKNYKQVLDSISAVAASGTAIANGIKNQAALADPARSGIGLENILVGEYVKNTIAQRPGSRFSQRAVSNSDYAAWCFAIGNCGEVQDLNKAVTAQRTDPKIVQAACSGTLAKNIQLRFVPDGKEIKAEIPNTKAVTQALTSPAAPQLQQNAPQRGRN